MLCLVNVYSMFSIEDMVLKFSIIIFYYSWLVLSKLMLILMMLKMFIFIIMLDIRVEVWEGVVGCVCGN